MKKNDIEYLVTNDLKIIENPTELDHKNNHSYCVIFSSFLKNSSGQGIYQYYSNRLLSDVEMIEGKYQFVYKGIFFESDLIESWLKNENIGINHHTISLSASITDKIGINKLLFFCQNSYNNYTHLRFVELFNYVKNLSEVGTHEAISQLIKKEKTINYLKKEIIKLNQKINRLEHF